MLESDSSLMARALELRHMSLQKAATLASSKRKLTLEGKAAMDESTVDLDRTVLENANAGL